MYRRPTDDEIKKWEDELNGFFSSLDYQRKANIDITDLCNKLGFEVYSLDLSEFIDESIERVDGVILVEGDYKVIGVNDKLNPQDSRFVVAHELSHYISENGNIHFAFRDKLNPGNQKDAHENKMDYMAAAILVPREKFKPYLDAFGIKNIRDIKTVEKNYSEFVKTFSAVFRVCQDVIIRRVVEVS